MCLYAMSKALEVREKLSILSLVELAHRFQAINLTMQVDLCDTFISWRVKLLPEVYQEATEVSELGLHVIGPGNFSRMWFVVKLAWPP